jgi:hypothetical protein
MDYVESFPSDAVFIISINDGWLQTIGTGSPYQSKDDALEFLSLHPDAEAFVINY